MVMRTTQAEMLLQIVQNSFDDGDNLMIEMRQKLTAHARRILEDEILLTKAWEQNQQDKQRFAQYMPRQETRESRQETRHEPRHELGNQTQPRAVLAPVKKVAE